MTVVRGASKRAGDGHGGVLPTYCPPTLFIPECVLLVAVLDAADWQDLPGFDVVLPNARWSNVFCPPWAPLPFASTWCGGQYCFYFSFPVRLVAFATFFSIFPVFFACQPRWRQALAQEAARGTSLRSRFHCGIVPLPFLFFFSLICVTLH